MPLAQIDHPTMHKRHLEAEPLCMLEDQGAIEQLVLRHMPGAIVAAFSDEPSFLASIARESRSACAGVATASSSSSSDEDRHRVAAGGVQPELEPRMDWRSKRACRFLKTARGCRNSNRPFKH